MGNDLPTAELGQTGMRVSRLGFGTALWRSERPYWTEESAHAVYKAALDAGIDFIDTAFDYAFAEEWIGSGLGNRYGEFALATKCGCTNTRPTQNNSDHLWTRENFHYNIDVSLERLERESVDILQPHNPTVAEFEGGDLGRALSEIRDAGKARHIGISTTLPHLPVFLEMGIFATMQIPYSALEREHEDWITKVADSGVGTIIRGGIAQGEGDTRQPAAKWDQFARAGLDELRQDGESRSAFVLRFTLSHPHIHTIIVGTSRAEHLAENVAAVRSGPLSADVYAEAKARLDAIGQSPSPVG
ncbi:MAG: aldo/keto reductase [Chloroflexota bacterium]|nr:aldo/keto reductase [Chloroflexota bacterium]MDE2935298.1 aldo/keto reductase [Chloroflexota bacterium]